MFELDYKQILWAITVLMIIIGYGKYMIDTWKGKTTPHLFSWIIFFTLGVISFLIQYNDGAWPGAWGTAGWFITAGIIGLLSLKQWEKNITKTDTISFILWLCAVGLYIFVSNPVYALILLIIINVFINLWFNITVVRLKISCWMLIMKKYNSGVLTLH